MKAFLKPEDMMPTLEETKNILEDARQRIAKQGRLADEKLLEKERNLEIVIANLEIEIGRVEE